MNENMKFSISIKPFDSNIIDYENFKREIGAASLLGTLEMKTRQESREWASGIDKLLGFLKFWFL